MRDAIMLPIKQYRQVSINILLKPEHIVNHIQKRTSFFNRFKHGPLRSLNPQYPFWDSLLYFFKGDALDYVKTEFKRIKEAQIFRNRPNTMGRMYKLNETYMLYNFEGDEIKKWKPVADSDSLNGFSKAYLSRSPEGHAVFSGLLDNRLPEDGVTQQSGFAGLIGPIKRHYSSSWRYWDWSEFNSIEIKFRGDGRKYNIVLNTGSNTSDIHYYDMYTYPLFTHGGPYWQTMVIPFSKFIFNYKGLIQDNQYNMPSERIKFLAFNLADTRDGPFKLEIDYIGLRIQTQGFYQDSPYEGYAFPHIKFKRLQVECDPPDADTR